MDKQRLYKILDFNRKNKDAIQDACMKFYLSIERQVPIVIPDIQTLAEMIFNKKGYKFLHIPMKSKEIGAFQLRLNNASYLVLNTSKSLANNNFAVAHELYHVLIQQEKNGNSAELYFNNYEENHNEMMANAFAGSILMPMDDFRLVNGLIPPFSSDDIRFRKPYTYELCKVITFMNYYKTTYMSAVIRCYELGIFNIEDEGLVESLLKNNSEERQKRIFESIANNKGYVSIMEPTFADDFEKLYNEAQNISDNHVENSMMTEEDVSYRLKGMLDAYKVIREEPRCQ